MARFWQNLLARFWQGFWQGFDKVLVIFQSFGNFPLLMLRKLKMKQGNQENKQWKAREPGKPQRFENLKIIEGLLLL